MKTSSSLFEQKKDDLTLMNQALTAAGGLEENEKLYISVEEFEGPLDVLLVMAKSQKIDLRKISISALADQYLTFIKIAQKIRLELAADYLVMASWLAFLKSKLLLPEPETPEDTRTAQELAAALHYQLQRLQAFRDKTAQLLALPQLHHDFFVRGMCEPLPVKKTTAWGDTLYDILLAYGSRKMQNERRTYHVRPPAVMRSEEILRRLFPMLQKMTVWQDLKDFLPVVDDQETVMQRSAYAGTLVACLELAKRELLEIDQTETFGMIQIRSKASLDTLAKIDVKELEIS